MAVNANNKEVVVAGNHYQVVGRELQPPADGMTRSDTVTQPIHGKDYVRPVIAVADIRAAIERNWRKVQQKRRA